MSITVAEKTGFFIKELQDRLNENHMKRVQVLFAHKNGLPMIKVVGMDLPGLKDRVKDLIEQHYCESFILVEEKKSVLLYRV